MKNYTLVPLLALVLLTGTAFAQSQSENGGPFALLWEAIEDLQQEIDDIEGQPGEPGPEGPPGPQGEKGDPGDGATLGAGDIAFCRVEKNCRTVLKTDGTAWEWNSQSGWFPAGLQPDFVPIPVDDIVLWNQFDLLDKNGNVWVWDNNAGWLNVGHP